MEKNKKINPTELLQWVNEEPLLRKALMKCMIERKLDTYEALELIHLAGIKAVKSEKKSGKE